MVGGSSGTVETVMRAMIIGTFVASADRQKSSREDEGGWSMLLA